MSMTTEQLRDMLKGAVKDVLETKLSKQQPTETSIDHACGCPDCYCGIIKKLNETSEVMCEDCHLPLGTKKFASKIPSCPNCGGTEVAEIERE